MAQEPQSVLRGNSTSRFQFTKTTLSAKIIQLRKVSQENHVRRMKLAYQKKETQGLVNNSACFATAFQRTSVNISKSSYSQPRNVQSCTGNTQSRRRQKSDALLPAKAKSDCANKSKHSDSPESNSIVKSAKSKKMPNTSPSNKSPSLSFSVETELHKKLSENASVAENNDFFIAKLQTEINKSIPSSQNKKMSSQYKDENNINKGKFFLKKSPIIVEDKKNFGEEKNKKLFAKIKPSRIPVLRSRKMKDKFKGNDYDKLETSNEVGNVSFKSILQDVENNMKNLNFPEAKEEQEHEMYIQRSYTPPSLECDCYEEDLYKNMYHTFCLEEARNEISLTDKWMNGILHDVENNKTSTESLVSTLKSIVGTPASREKNSPGTLRKETTSEDQHIVEDFDIPCTYDYTTDITDTEDNLELHYEIENRADEKSEQGVNDSNKWDDADFEADSTITLPSDKDLELAEHRDSVYRSLPDYPNTPYNLRCARHKLKRSNSIFRSIEIESADGGNKAKVVKTRKKSCNTTPKRIKSGKKKKAKKQILRQRED